MLRLPSDLKAWLAEQAAQNERSLNGQIVWLLRQAMAPVEEPRALCAHWRGNNVNSAAYVATFGAPDANVTTRASGT